MWRCLAYWDYHKVFLLSITFFEGTDLQAFLPLPFRQSQLFLSKILVVAMTIAPLFFPLLVLFLLTGWRHNTFS